MSVLIALPLGCFILAAAFLLRDRLSEIVKELKRIADALEEGVDRQ
jgi:hypothetical protein